jgi:hypothetical protein
VRGLREVKDVQEDGGIGKSQNENVCELSILSQDMDTNE